MTKVIAFLTRKGTVRVVYWLAILTALGQIYLDSINSAIITLVLAFIFDWACGKVRGA